MYLQHYCLFHVILSTNGRLRKYRPWIWPWTSRHWLDGWKSCWELDLALVELSSVPPLWFVLLNNQGFFPWPDTPYASNSSIIRYHGLTNLEISMATVCPQTLKSIDFQKTFIRRTIEPQLHKNDAQNSKTLGLLSQHDLIIEVIIMSVDWLLPW